MKNYVVPFILVAGTAYAMEKNAMIDKTLDPQVISAARTGDINKMRALISNGANINARDEEFKATALHWAIGSKGLSDAQRMAMVKFLTNETAIDINGTNKFKTTPLALAIFEYRPALAEELLKKERIDVNVVNVHGDTAMRYAELFGYKNLQELILKKGGSGADAHVSRITIIRKDTEPLTREFAQNGSDPYFELLAELRKKGPDATLALARTMVKEKEEWVLNSLYWFAISQGRFEIVKLLLDAGMAFDTLYINDESGYLRIVEKTSLQIAELYGDQPIIDLLKAYTEFKDSLVRNTANAESVRQFCEKGFSIHARNRYAGKYGCGDVSWLYIAIQTAHLDTVKALIEAGAPIDSTGKFDLPPLLVAAGEKSELEVQYLLERGANLTAALKWCVSKDHIKFLTDTACKLYSSKAKF